MNLILAVLMIFAAVSPSVDQERRIKKLEASLMAPCCYSQTIDEHMSSEAAQMRDEVSQMVFAGRSDRDILEYYRVKYGETILVVPSGNAGVFAFGVPIGITLAVIILGILVASSLHRRSAVRAGAAYPESIPAEVLQRIRKDIQDQF